MGGACSLGGTLDVDGKFTRQFDPVGYRNVDSRIREEREEPSAVRECTDRERTPGAELAQKSPLGENGTACRVVIDAAQRVDNAIVISATFDRDTSLADGWDELGRIELVRDHLGEPQHFESSNRHHDGTAIGDSFESGRDVAPELGEAEVGPSAPELSPSADRPRGDEGANRKIDQRSSDERIADRAPLGERPDDEPLLWNGRQILGGVDGEIGATVENGSLHLFHEHALPADRVERYIGGLRAIAVRIDRQQLDNVAGRLELCGDGSGLRGRLGTAPGRDSNRRHGDSARSAEIEQISHRGGVALALRRACLLA